MNRGKATGARRLRLVLLLVIHSFPVYYSYSTHVNAYPSGSLYYH